MPKTRRKFWKDKLEGNVRRDKKNRKLLRADGWKVVTVWECELENGSNIRRKLKYHMSKK